MGIASPASAAPCGFSVDGVGNGTYVHCANTFVLVKGHWSGGSTFTNCFRPWEIGYYGPDAGQRVVKVYYVPVRPNLVTFPNGTVGCSLYQPRL
ncbi:DUF6355 family natural product biosynthesis protein [Actinokineospora iranica]|uniref:Uncharacterized protein n=1 Tax=Actinokineospora iranica TaxID=1271860 RepID=A0A1G6VV39_9PSEU|nr:DUF6355 family natural product biosynthesis protein [Actinokineospora iranica]SDD56685.1 hypothetical protein SAMN05216174_11379 [Actinokineospora iranica]